MTQQQLDDIGIELALILMEDSPDLKVVFRHLEVIRQSLSAGFKPSLTVQGALGLATIEFAAAGPAPRTEHERRIEEKVLASARKLARKAGLL